MALFRGASHHLPHLNHEGAGNDEDVVDRRLSSFLGYVSLRPKTMHQDVPYVAVANLAIPDFMKRPRYHILTTVLGPADGVMPFRGTPYYKPWSIHHPAAQPPVKAPRSGKAAPAPPLNRALCLHTSVYCALSLKSSSFYCSAVCSHEMLSMVWKSKGIEVGKENAALKGKDPAARLKAPPSMGDICTAGLTLEDCLSVLRSPEVRASGCLESITALDFLQKSLWEQGASLTGDGVSSPSQDPSDALLDGLSLNEFVALIDRVDEQVLGSLGIEPPPWPPGCGVTPEIWRKEQRAILLYDAPPKKLAALQAAAHPTAKKRQQSWLSLISRLRSSTKELWDERSHPANLKLQDHFLNSSKSLAALFRAARTMALAEMLTGPAATAFGPGDRASHLIAALHRAHEFAKREARLCIAEYLANGMPVIMPAMRDPDDDETVDHSVLVVGMHYQSSESADDWPYELSEAFLPSSFVLHDFSQPPFAEARVQNIITVGGTRQVKEIEVDSNNPGASPMVAVPDLGISYLALTPSGVNIGVYAIRQAAKAFLRQIDPEFGNPKEQFKDYRKAFGIIADEMDVCLRVRKLSFDDLMRMYVHPVCATQDESFAWIDLLCPELAAIKAAIKKRLIACPNYEFTGGRQQLDEQHPHLKGLRRRLSAGLIRILELEEAIDSRSRQAALRKEPARTKKLVAAQLAEASAIRQQQTRLPVGPQTGAPVSIKQLKNQLALCHTQTAAIKKALVKRPATLSPTPGDDVDRLRDQWWCVECHPASFRSNSFRNYESNTDPVAVLCWRTDQGGAHPAGRLAEAPEITIRAIKPRWSFFTMGELSIPFSTRCPAQKRTGTEP